MHHWFHPRVPPQLYDNFPLFPSIPLFSLEYSPAFPPFYKKYCCFLRNHCMIASLITKFGGNLAVEDLEDLGSFLRLIQAVNWFTKFLEKKLKVKTFVKVFSVLTKNCAAVSWRSVLCWSWTIIVIVLLYLRHQTVDRKAGRETRAHPGQGKKGIGITIYIPAKDNTEERVNSLIFWCNERE